MREQRLDVTCLVQSKHIRYLRTDTESSDIVVGVHGGEKEPEEKVKNRSHDDVQSTRKM